MAWTQLTNNAKTTLSAGCTDVATAITPTAKTTFPDPEDDGSFYVTIWDADTYPDPGDDPGMEIVLVTADAAANWTVTRGQAGTAGAAHVAGDAVRLLWIAEHAQEIQDTIDAHVGNVANPHAVTASQTGAASAGDLSAHIGDDDHTQYHTDGRALTWLGTRSTTDLPEGTGLYHTTARARAAVSATTPLGYDSATGVFSIQAASAAQAGYLSAADWTAFDAKQSELTLPLTHENGGLEADVSAYAGLLKISGGVTSAITDSSANWDAAYSHVSANGASHTYIDQDVTTAASPQFAGLDLGNGILVFGSSDDMYLKYTSHASIATLNLYPFGSSIVNSRYVARCDEAVGRIASFTAATNAQTTPASTNRPGFINFVITAADPNALKGRVDVWVNTGDLNEIALTLNDNKSADFASYVNAVSGFKDNGTAGIDTTFVDNDGNTITVSGGIITAKTAP